MAAFKTDIETNYNTVIAEKAKSLGMSRQKYIEINIIDAHAKELMINKLFEFGERKLNKG